MVQSSQSTSKYLMEKWHTDRDKALLDRTGFTDAELEWLDLDPDTLPQYGDGNPKLYDVAVDPIDPLTPTGKKYNLLDDPRIG